MNNILSIDPGTSQSAFVWYEDGVIKEKGIVPNHDIFGWIYSEQPELVSIEMIASYGMPVGRDVFETVVWIGRFMEASLSNQIKTTRCYRKDIKMHLCNSTRAKDSNIRQALIDKYGKTGTKNDPNPFYNDSKVKMSKDIWAALAVLDYTLSKKTHEIPLDV